MVIAEQIRAAFAGTSQRKTRPRQLIAECLIERAAAGVDFTVDDLWHTLRQKEPQMGRATVYRAVEMLVQVGLLDRVEFADGTHHYRVCGGTHHHHLTCKRCRLVVEIDLCLPAEQLLALGQQTGFTIEGHALTVFGRCERCRVQAAPEQEAP
ncbi:MAG TPA: transcriptional repressor [Ktedonobacteraceae bacterium]|jgi:Fe2+ or Zn2+ uptake regulation protein|nr:transcriptional repressor [Ktedonobacteraceae bacterium]